MTKSVNKATLVGFVGRDPDVRTTNNGNKVANLAVATSERWTDPHGQQQERTEWHRVTVFNEHNAKFAENYVRKGHMIYVEGQLRTRKWTDNNNIERYTTEVAITNYNGQLILLTPSSGQPNAIQQQAPAQQAPAQADKPADKTEPPKELDDEIPF